MKICQLKQSSLTCNKRKKSLGRCKIRDKWYFYLCFYRKGWL